MYNFVLFSFQKMLIYFADNVYNHVLHQKRLFFFFLFWPMKIKFKTKRNISNNMIKINNFLVRIIQIIRYAFYYYHIFVSTWQVHFICKSKVKLATIVEGDPKAPFSIATTPRCRGGRYSIPWIAPLYPWTVPYNAEC